MVQKKHINLKLPAQGMKETRILNHLSKEIEGIMILGDTYIVENIGVHEIERGILSALLNFGRSILSSIISQKVEVVRHAKLVSPGGDAFERKGDCVRQYVSVFGAIDIQRPSYWHESTGKVYYADEVLQLPVDSKLSYFLQELMADSGSEEDYRQSVFLLNKCWVWGLAASALSATWRTWAALWKTTTRAGKRMWCGSHRPWIVMPCHLTAKGFPK